MPATKIKKVSFKKSSNKKSSNKKSSNKKPSVKKNKKSSVKKNKKSSNKKKPKKKSSVKKKPMSSNEFYDVKFKVRVTVNPSDIVIQTKKTNGKNGARKITFKTTKLNDGRVLYKIWKNEKA